MTDAHLDYDGWEWHYDTAAPEVLTHVVQTGSNTDLLLPASLDESTPLTTIADYAFRNNTVITSVIFQNTVTDMGISAFDGCSELIEAFLPENITTIGDYTFSSCFKLYRVDIPGVTSIGPGAFQYCKALVSVTLPSTLKTLAHRVYQYCSSLTDVTITSELTDIGYAAFADCPLLTDILFFGLVAPTKVADEWEFNNAVTIKGHAYTTSNFPPPDDAFYGLTMGDALRE